MSVTAAGSGDRDPDRPGAGAVPGSYRAGEIPARSAAS